MSMRRIRRALISVSDKTNLIELAKTLVEFDVELISTGGTFKAIKEAGLPVREVSEVTKFPEMLDGRVKTLHPMIHGGILYIRGNSEHEATIDKHGIGPIDLVVVNLYPFEATVAKPGVEWHEVVENIDIGGPSLIRAAAKNYDGVAVLVDPSQYPDFIHFFRSRKGNTLYEWRRELAAEAFARTAEYDSKIAREFASTRSMAQIMTDAMKESFQTFQIEAPCHQKGELFPESFSITLTKNMNLRYGENPHQVGAFYVEPTAPSGFISSAKQIHGKELSYNNILDLDAAWNLVCEFQQAAAVVVKHNNPCGVGIATTLVESFQKAYEGDPLSAFGGILAFNRTVDAASAEQITEPNRFIEAIIAPEFEARALEILTTRPTWKKNVRLMTTGGLPNTSPPGLDWRRVRGGLLMQSWGEGADNPTDWKVVSKRTPTDQERTDVEFAWLVCKHVKSNAIVFAKNGQVVGVGAGQMSRIDSTELAHRKAGDRSKGAVMASDAFFPFRDNVDAAAKAGITAIIQPGGSMRDAESIQAADEHGMAMLFTGVRHFRH